MTLLVSKTDSLGDQIFASSFVQMLLSQYPEGHFFWFVRRGYEVGSKLFDGSGVFFPDQTRSAEDESVRCLEFSERPRPSPGWERVTFVPISMDAYSVVHLGELVLANLDWWLRFARGLHAEVAVAGTLSLNWFDWALVCGSGAGTRAGCENGEGWREIPQLIDFVGRISGNKPRFSHSIDFEYDRSELESFALLGEVLTGKPSPREFRIAPEKGQSRVRQNSIVIAPGAGDPQKAYPRSELLEVVKILSGGADRITVLEGPKDEEVVTQFCQLLDADQIDHTRVRFASADLPDLVASLRSAALLVCNDTLYAHLAAWVGAPTVAIWGQGHAERFVPPSGNITILQVDIQCRGCDWNCIFAERRCIISLEPSHIVDACLERLEVRKAREPVLLRKLTSQTSPEEVREAFRSAIIKLAARNRHTHNTLGAAVEEQRKWIDLFRVEADLWRVEKTRLEARAQELQNVYSELAFLREYRRQVDKVLNPFRKLPGFKWLVRAIRMQVRRRSIDFNKK
jgi:ADP-heptose:LPS heptosyltransferase